MTNDVKVEGEGAQWSYCSGVGYIGNPMSWTDVEQLRAAVLAAKSYVALAVGDFILAGEYAETLLERTNLPGGYKMLGNLYRAESLILQDRLSEAIKHLNPENISDVNVNFSSDNRSSVGTAGGGWSPLDVSEGRAVVEYNLGVGFALREEWDKASSLATQLYNRCSQIHKAKYIPNVNISASNNSIFSSNKQTVIYFGNFMSNQIFCNGLSILVFCTYVR